MLYDNFNFLILLIPILIFFTVGTNSKIFHKSSKTTTEVVEDQVIFNKLIKLTYTQSLALEGSLFSPTEFETDSVDEYTPTSEYSQSSVNDFFDNVESFVNATFDPIFGQNDGLIRGDVGEFFEDIGIGNFIGSLGSAFGKSTSVDTSVEYKETGFQVSKIWNQPQFDIIRHAIGIKDINVAQFRYAPSSQIISKPFTSPKEIIKIVCRASQFVPSIFPPGNYIEYYIRPNQEDIEWTRINPLDFATVFDETGKIIPRVVNFNTEQPLQSRLEETYVLTEKPVREVVFKAILKRPAELQNTTVSADGYTPVLKSYRLLMTPKNGL